MNQYEKNGQEFGWGPGLVTLNPDKAKLLKDYAIGKVLDLACGSGIYTNHLNELGHQAIGLDNQPEFIKKAKKAYPKVDFRLGDVAKLPFPKNSFDTVVLFDILEHVDDKKVIREALRVGKRLIISVPKENETILTNYGLSHAHYLDRTHERVYSGEMLTKILNDQKLKIISQKPALPISLSGLLIHRLSNGSPMKRLLLKAILKPFLPEPPIYSTFFAVAEKN